jgi:AcrR family transcriptional regulator
MTARASAPADSNRGRAGRPRDAAATKEALLAAAQSLFGERGFEATTIRDIGDRAEVDPALIARYYGSKADLYIAAVVAEAKSDQTEFEHLSDVAEALITRTDRQGLGPVTQALIRSDTSDEIRHAAQAHLTRRIVTPLAADITSRGLDRAELRAEITASALLGINLARALGWFPQLQRTGKDELVELITTLLDQPPLTPGQRTKQSKSAIP